MTDTLSSEACLIASMLFHNDLIEKIAARVPVEAFQDKKNRLLYETALSVHAKHKRLDSILLKEALGPRLLEAGGLSYLTALMENTPDTKAWEPYVAAVVERYHLDRLKEGCLTVAEGVENGDDLMTALGMVQRLAQRPSSVDREKLSDLVAQSVGSLDEMRAQTNALKFGYRVLDDATGGLRKGKLFVVGGKTSHGKTTFALNVVVNILKANPQARVVYNAFEDRDQLSGRLAALEFSIPLEGFCKPDRMCKEDYEALKGKLKELEKYNDRLVFLSGVQNARLREVCEEWKPDIVIVDYIQRYAHKYNVGADGNKVHEIGRITSELQDIAIDKKTAIVLISQFSRRQEEARFRRPQLNDLKESGDLENIADVVLLLWWKHHENSKEPPENYEVLVEKNKLGPKVEALLKLDVETLRLTDGKP